MNKPEEKLPVGLAIWTPWPRGEGVNHHLVRRGGGGRESERSITWRESEICLERDVAESGDYILGNGDNQRNSWIVEVHSWKKSRIFTPITTSTTKEGYLFERSSSKKPTSHRESGGRP